MFERLIHADWSTHDEKKWMMIAERTVGGWQVAAPRLAPAGPELIGRWLFNNSTVLAGFDFPIGVPAAFGKKTGLVVSGKRWLNLDLANGLRFLMSPRSPGRFR